MTANSPANSRNFHHGRTAQFTGSDYRQGPDVVYRSIQNKVYQGVTQGLVRILFTDIDSTLVLGAGHSDEEIRNSNTTARTLIGRLNSDRCIVVPITGSHFDSGTKTTESILDRIRSGVLPEIGIDENGDKFLVDAYVTDGGARAVHKVNNTSHSFDSRYWDFMQTGNYDYESAYDSAERIRSEIALEGSMVVDWSKIKGYEEDTAMEAIFFQPGTQDGTHRHSNKLALYFYAATIEQRDLIEARFRAELAKKQLGVVCCEERDANARARTVFGEKADRDGFPLKYCLDIAPFNKATAIDYFIRYVQCVKTEAELQLGKARSILEAWACGDSGNDIPLMTSGHISHVVLVGGASAELSRLEPKFRKLGKQVYIEDDPTIKGPGSILKAWSALTSGHR
jgi:hydroxymethylpyrimidine pyrophosphatase-like HAD family hydrolase